MFVLSIVLGILALGLLGINIVLYRDIRKIDKEICQELDKERI